MQEIIDIYYTKIDSEKVYKETAVYNDDAFVFGKILDSENGESLASVEAYDKQQKIVADIPYEKLSVEERRLRAKADLREYFIAEFDKNNSVNDKNSKKEKI